MAKMIKSLKREIGSLYRKGKGKAMHLIYLQALINSMKDYKNGADEKDSIKKLVFYGVKTINTKPKDEYLNLETIQSNIDFNNVILGAIGTLTPKELMNIFPLDKYYKGAKYESKDYFYSMNYIKDHGINKPIKDPISFLWEYTNINTSIFLMNVLGEIDNLRISQGNQSMASEFMEAQGIKPLRKYTDQRGKDFFINDKGQTMRIKKKYPRYLKLVK